MKKFEIDYIVPSVNNANLTEIRFEYSEENYSFPFHNVHLQQLNGIEPQWFTRIEGEFIFIDNLSFAHTNETFPNAVKDLIDLFDQDIPVSECFCKWTKYGIIKGHTFTAADLFSKDWKKVSVYTKTLLKKDY